eukprot:CAMPEP_0176485592 /NCGR_PEP_ID=MMETSP0200_2-20121128/5119_1 /TAXON_ID=947934 /ORGANISM="Chaetoceros sp., Strain GSL56" /LENGTH=627 /DNA_ID=CAMNT_0017882241 /DNA_START=472 /DNA_END=2355 /DNA_ORIENTATION=+
MMSLQHNSVPLVTVFKNLTNIGVAFGDYFFFGTKVDLLIIVSFVLILIGATFSADKDTSTSSQGLLWMILNCVATAGYILYMKFATKTIDLSKFGMVFYNNILCILFLFPVTLLNGEIRLFMNTKAFHSFDFCWKLIFAGFVGFFLNFASLNCVSTTSPTTFAIVGSLNRIPIIILGWYLFDADISSETWFFITVSLLGGFTYSYAKLQSGKENVTETIDVPTDSNWKNQINRGVKVIFIVLLLSICNFSLMPSMPQLLEYKGISSNRKEFHSTKIIATWVLSNQGNKARDTVNYAYYVDIAQALNANEQVSVCDGSIEHCFNQSKVIQENFGDMVVLTPIINHEIFSNGIQGISKAADKLASDINNIFRNYSLEMGPRVSVIAMVNKAYQSLDDKMDALLTPFEKLRTMPHFSLIATTWSPHAANFSKRFDVPFIYVPFGVRNDIFKLTSKFVPFEERTCDVFLRWDTNHEKYELREEIHHTLVGKTGLNSSDIIVSAPTHFLTLPEYLTEIAKCKMSITTIGMPNHLDLLGTRYYEIMASGTSLLLAQRPHSKEAQDAQKNLGMEDGITIVEFSQVDDLLAKIRYFIKNTKEAYKIIDNAQKITEYNTWEQRAQRIIRGILENMK